MNPKKIVSRETKAFQNHTQKILKMKALKNQNSSFSKFLKKHKIIRYIFITLLALVSIMFVIFMFSGGSLIDWVIFGEQAEQRTFIFEVVFAMIIIIASIVVSIILNNKKK